MPRGKWNSENRDKVSEHRKRYRNKNGDKIKSSVREARDARKQALIERVGSCCNRCGGVFPLAVYHFHHIDPATKDIKIASLMCSSSAEKLAMLDIEIAKCILVCANCHAMIHHPDSPRVIAYEPEYCI